jgi:hypothetical protein
LLLRRIHEEPLQKKVCGYLSQGYTLTGACEKTGISKYFYWRRYIEPLVGDFEKHSVTIGKATGNLEYKNIPDYKPAKREFPVPPAVNPNPPKTLSYYRGCGVGGIKEDPVYESENTQRGQLIRKITSAWFTRGKWEWSLFETKKKQPVVVQGKQKVDLCGRFGAETFRDLEGEAWIIHQKKNLSDKTEPYTWVVIESKFKTALKYGRDYRRSYDIYIGALTDWKLKEEDKSNIVSKKKRDRMAEGYGCTTGVIDNEIDWDALENIIMKMATGRIRTLGVRRFSGYTRGYKTDPERILPDRLEPEEYEAKRRDIEYWDETDFIMDMLQYYKDDRRLFKFFLQYAKQQGYILLGERNSMRELQEW